VGGGAPHEEDALWRKVLKKKKKKKKTNAPGPKERERKGLRAPAKPLAKKKKGKNETIIPRGGKGNLTSIGRGGRFIGKKGVRERPKRKGFLKEEKKKKRKKSRLR